MEVIAHSIRSRPQRPNPCQNQFSVQSHEAAACLLRRRCADRCTAFLSHKTIHRHKHGGTHHGIPDAAVFSFGTVRKERSAVRKGSEEHGKCPVPASETAAVPH